MLTIDTPRAWRDQEYRDTLTAAQLADLETHPAGAVELPASVLAMTQHGDAGPGWDPAAFSTEYTVCDTIWQCSVTTRSSGDTLGAFC